MSVDQQLEPPVLRQKSGNVADGSVPNMTVISGTPQSDSAPIGGKAEKRPFIIRYGKHLRGFFDRMIASSSLVPNDPVLDVRDFPWTQHLRDNWQAIRDEAINAAMGEKSPSFSLPVGLGSGFSSGG